MNVPAKSLIDRYHASTILHPTHPGDTMNKTDIEAVLEVISTCTKIRKLQELYYHYKHIPALEDALIARKDYLLYGIK
jgi:pyruvate-formate lyase-activating enzyme